MKKIFYCITLSVILFSCNHQIDVPTVVETDVLSDDLRSYKDIKRIALDAVDLFSSGVNTKTEDSRQISSILPCMTPQTKSDQSSPLFYVVNFTDDNGYVIVGASVSSPEIIVYSDCGYYNGIHSENDGLNIYMDEISNQSLSSTREFIDIPTPSYLETTTNTSTETNNPLVQVSWHQQEPFNWYCSSPFNNNVPAGCVAIAIAQIMSVYSHPSSITLSYPGATSSSISLDWDEMKLDQHTCYHSSSCQYCIQNASLVREIGQRVGMTYSVGGSGAQSSNSPSTLSSFGYHTSSYTNYSISSVMSSLNAEHPVYIRAENTSSGHAWVTDGSKYICTTKKTHEVTGTSRTLVATEYVKQWYLHFNYGWNGTDNGYYLALQKESGQGSIISGGSYDDTIVSIFSGPFNNNVKIITDIYPQ